MMAKQATQSDVILYAHGAAAFQLLRAGVELGLFELLDKKPLASQKEIAKALKLPPILCGFCCLA